MQHSTRANGFAGQGQIHGDTPITYSIVFLNGDSKSLTDGYWTERAFLTSSRLRIKVEGLLNGVLADGWQHTIRYTPAGLKFDFRLFMLGYRCRLLRQNDQ